MSRASFFLAACTFSLGLIAGPLGFDALAQPADGKTPTLPYHFDTQPVPPGAPVRPGFDAADDPSALVTDHAVLACEISQIVKASLEVDVAIFGSLCIDGVSYWIFAQKPKLGHPFTIFPRLSPSGGIVDCTEHDVRRAAQKSAPAFDINDDENRVICHKAPR